MRKFVTCHDGPKFSIFYAKRGHRTEENTPLPVVAMVTYISYVLVQPVKLKALQSFSSFQYLLVLSNNETFL